MPRDASTRDPTLSRRAALGAAVGASTVGLAGCLASAPLPGPGAIGEAVLGSSDRGGGSADVPAETWPEFGATPQNTGATGRVSGPGPDDAELAWRYDGGTPTMNTSPVVADGTVYVAGSGDPGHIHALDVETGEQRWEFTPSGYVSSALALADGVLYFGTWGARIYALEAETGDVRWERAVGHRFGASSPTVVDGTVYVGTIGDGPLTVETGTDVDVEGPALLAVDAATGDIEWQRRGFDERANIKSSPAVADGIAYLGVENTLYALDAETGEDRWRRRLPTHPDSSPTVANGLVYYAAPIDSFLGPPTAVWALDARTGRVHWRAGIPDQSLRTSPAVTEGRLYVAASSSRICLAAGDGDCSGVTRGRLYALDARTGTRRWQAEIEPDARSSPAVADGVVYVGCADGLSAVTTRGQNAWSVSFDGADGDRPYVDSSPAVASDHVFVGASDGRVRAIRSADRS